MVEGDADGGEKLEEADDERGAVVGLNKGGGRGVQGEEQRRVWMANKTCADQRSKDRDLHVEDAGGGVVDPAVDNCSADVVNTRVVVVLNPLGHLRELRRSLSIDAD